MAKNKSQDNQYSQSSITYIAIGTAVGLLLLVGGYLLWSGLTTTEEGDTDPAEVSTIRYESPASESDVRESILEKLASDTQSWETYQNEEANMTFKYPSSWSAEDGTIEAESVSNGESTPLELSKVTVSKGEYSFRIYLIETGPGSEFCVDETTLNIPDLRDYLYDGTDYTFIVGQSGDYYVTTEINEEEEVMLAHVCLDEMLIGEFVNKLPSGKPISFSFPVGNPNPETLTEMYTIIATYAEIESTRGVMITP